MTNIEKEVTKYRELLYLNSLKVANQALMDAESEGYEVSSSLLSASSSLLKLDIQKVIDSADTGAQMAELINNILKDKKENK